MNRIVFNHNGKLKIIIPAPGFKAVDLLHQVPADATNVRLLDKADIPKDRTFRAAWVLANDVVDVDRPRAEQIVMDKVREEREAEFAKTDAEYMAAVQKGDTAKAQAAAARAQKLRDAPAKDLSKLTLDELAAVTLGSLLE